MIRHLFLLLISSLILAGCGSSGSKSNFTIAFLDAFEDETIAQAKKGFFVALKDSGYIPEQNIRVLYRNAQGDIPALTQSVDFFVTSGVDLIVANTTLSTISAVKKTKSIPICMMVSGSTELTGLRDKSGKDPENLFGVYETLEYIDTALTLTQELRPGAKRIGTIINQSEPQSVDALERIKKNALAMGMEVIALPASGSAETQLVTEQLLSQNIDVFFALPDNTIFSSFETIAAACKRKGVPILTSETGLVARGADMAFGADIYQWGYDAGIEAVKFFKTGVPTSMVLIVVGKT
jgi:putative ABC transport system substrate-binding protein